MGEERIELQEAEAEVIGFTDCRVKIQISKGGYGITLAVPFEKIRKLDGKAAG